MITKIVLKKLQFQCIICIEYKKYCITNTSTEAFKKDTTLRNVIEYLLKYLIKLPINKIVQYLSKSLNILL